MQPLTTTRSLLKCANDMHTKQYLQFCLFDTKKSYLPEIEQNPLS